MPITVKRQDELEKLWENFTKLPELESVEYPEPTSKQDTDPTN